MRQQSLIVLFVGLLAVSVSSWAATCGYPYPTTYGGIAPTVVSFDPGQPKAVVFSNGGGFVLDLNDPDAPRALFEGSDSSAPPLTMQSTGNVKAALANDWLLLSRGSYSRYLTMYDVSEPTDHWNWTYVSVPQPGSPLAVAMRDNIASVVYRTPEGTGVLVVYLVGGAAALEELGRVDVTGAETIVLSGTLAAVADYWGIDIVDLSDPAAPVVLDHVTDPADDLAVTGDLLVARRQEGGSSESRIVVYDISDPADVQLLGATDAFYHITSISAAGDYAYLGRAWQDGTGRPLGETLVVDLGDPEFPTIGSPLATGAAFDVKVKDGLILTAARVEGARYGRLADPLTLADPPTRFSGRLYENVEVDNGRLYLPAPWEGVWIVEPTGDNSLVELGLWTSDMLHYGMPFSVADGMLWVIEDHSIVVVDVSDPSAPLTIAKLPEPDAGVRAIASAAGIAAVAVSNTNTIRFIDARDPTQVVWAAQLTTGGSGSTDRMSMDGSSLVWVDQNAVHVADVADPWLPFETATYSPEDLDPGAIDYVITDVAVDGWRAWINLVRFGGYSSYHLGVLIDVTDPSVPTIVGPCVGSGDSIAAAGPVYVSASPMYPPNGEAYVVLADLRNPQVVINGFGTDDVFGDGAVTDGLHAFGARGVLEMIDFSCTELFDVYSDGFESGDTSMWWATTP